MEGLGHLGVRLLYVGFGGALGAGLRYLTSVAMRRADIGVGFPWATLLVNVVGSFALGLFLGVLVTGRIGVSEEMKLFLAVGVFGGLTTFSTFAVETLAPLQAGDLKRGLLNIALSLGLGLAACLAGLVLGEKL